MIERFKLYEVLVVKTTFDTNNHIPTTGNLGSIKLRMRCSKLSRLSPAAARIMASYSLESSLFNRVPTLPQVLLSLYLGDTL